MDENLELQGTITVRATVELDATGETFTAPYVVDVTGPEGTVELTEQGVAEGTRFLVEPAAPLGTLPVATPGS